MKNALLLSLALIAVGPVAVEGQHVGDKVRFELGGVEHKYMIIGMRPDYLTVLHFEQELQVGPNMDPQWYKPKNAALNIVAAAFGGAIVPILSDDPAFSWQVGAGGGALLGAILWAISPGTWTDVF